MSALRPILITGSHRSGSTWVGECIAVSNHVGYVREPFLPIDSGKRRPGQRAGVYSARVPNFFHSVAEGDAPQHRIAMRNLIHFNYDFKAELPWIQSPKDVARMFRDAGRFLYYKTGRRRLLMKDPLAFFSAPWLYKNFNFQVVVVIRNPAGFISSLKKANWFFPFADIINQPYLMTNFAGAYGAKIIEYHSSDRKSVIEEGALLWNLIHWNIKQWQEDYPDWEYVRHEDLCAQPEEEFGRLFEALALPMDKGERAKLLEKTRGQGQAETGSSKKDILSVKGRESREVVDLWKTRLSPDDIEEMRSFLDRDLVAYFYGDSTYKQLLHA